MHRIFITALLVTSMQVTVAMQQLRNAICNRPITSVTTTAITTSLVTYGCTHPENWRKNPIKEFRKKQIRRELAKQHAEMNMIISDR